ncbi:Pyridoxine-5'-phosphate oxidase-like [Homarus americanus]|uniref:pyridoxal 5'-phosphate synthase n=1 Tax=Homarus americanus TaxID=6706 RepID=A0A8J5TLA9_HOMAM|nr:Pyridoxine-5'-phosphate oxidase-like [Homarus americanus]
MIVQLWLFRPHFRHVVIRGRMALFKENVVTGGRQEDVKDMSIDIGGMRKPYKGKNEAFTEDDLVAKEPIAQFASWFDEACHTPGIIEANAMCIATATKCGKPSARMVLLKGYGKDGFRFFTNYGSRKGKELGRVEKLGEDVSKEYFHSRPRSSQIGACLSPQSQVICGRHVLTEKDEQLNEEYKDETKLIPKPECWGGFRVVPETIEFWQGQTTRIHDRICFRKPATDEVIDESLTKQECGHRLPCEAYSAQWNGRPNMNMSWKPEDWTDI